MEYMLMPLKKFADFEGRARRKEYWMFVLFSIIVSIPLSIIDAMLFNTAEGGVGIFGLIFQLAILVPSIAVAIRRMHDVGKSGWHILIPFYNLYLAVTEGDRGPNQYGPDPKNPHDDINAIGKDELV